MGSVTSEYYSCVWAWLYRAKDYSDSQGRAMKTSKPVCCSTMLWSGKQYGWLCAAFILMRPVPGLLVWFQC